MKKYQYIIHAIQDTCIEVHDMPDDICLVHGTIMDIVQGEKLCVKCEIKTNDNTSTQSSLYIGAGRNFQRRLS
jgi:hypothetical protein